MVCMSIYIYMLTGGCPDLGSHPGAVPGPRQESRSKASRLRGCQGRFCKTLNSKAHGSKTAPRFV